MANDPGISRGERAAMRGVRESKGRQQRRPNPLAQRRTSGTNSTIS
ncbi:MAG TPA: hypothetical protein VLL57_12690 [Candidatus Binataceae bacterium]|nr:hypothetical protein [Candidatus Binataceae bacterium]